MPGRVLPDSAVEILNNIELRLDNLESYGWVIAPGGLLKIQDSSYRDRVLIGQMTDGKCGIRIYDSSGTLQNDLTHS